MEFIVDIHKLPKNLLSQSEINLKIMPSTLDKIKSLFFVTEETPEEAKPAEPQKSTPQPAPVKSETKPSIPTNAGLDEKILASLSKAIDDNNMSGFDFLEFKNSIKALENLPMDEATKYRSAFATAATMGVNLDSLVKSANFYKEVLNKEKGKFEDALSLQVDKNVIEKQKQVESMNAEVLKKSEQIKQLTEQIQTIQAEIEKHQAFITEANSKIEATKANFEFTFGHLSSQIDEDVAKMQKFLSA